MCVLRTAPILLFRHTIHMYCIYTRRREGLAKYRGTTQRYVYCIYKVPKTKVHKLSYF